ncbi:c-type cytochrome [Paralcaligenes ureilyticus]|uniref:Cytochrome c553 n=1 Tax=Paralcaligenes ureilyticus TaxID=627131 RepID=A0A4V2UXD2_9BURK|nr:cytochrome c [Paralcaligenes ureilyticus]TCT03038.1 cytochrome c553 [Paralcaligenes ureilyticus]
MLKATLLVNTMVAGVLCAAAANAADPAVGQKLYETTCAACHGATGVSIAPIYPNLVDQKEQYLVQQLKAFRDGSRQNPIMQPMAKNLSDTDIANIAAYLSNLKP